MRLFSISLLFFALLFQAPALAQVKAKSLVKTTEARQKFNKRDYWGALKLYREVLKTEKESAQLNMRVGEVQYALKHYDIAKEYLLTAEKLMDGPDEDLTLLLGRTYHRLAEVAKAKDYYQQYKAWLDKRHRRMSG